MKHRSLIKSRIIAAWRECIEDDYCNQRINSERSLQASFWSHINASLPKTQRLFIEPSLTIRGRSGVRRILPDIVICNTREVISVIELKYQPRAKPKYIKDIESLSTIAAKRKQIAISNIRFRGSERDSTVYSLSENILFVWAGVHAENNSDALFSAGHSALANCYLELHAVTQKDGTPKISIRK